MAVAAFLCNVLLATDLEAIDRAWCDAGGLGELVEVKLGQSACCNVIGR